MDVWLAEDVEIETVPGWLLQAGVPGENDDFSLDVASLLVAGSTHGPPSYSRFVRPVTGV